MSTSRSRPSDKGGGEGGWSGLQKNFLWLFGPQFDLKIRGGDVPPPRAPPLDPPLLRKKAELAAVVQKVDSAVHWMNPYLLDSATGHFRVPPGPLFQTEGRCSAFDMEIIFHSHANKTHFHKKGCAPSLILKVRVFGTRKWPIHTWLQGLGGIKQMQCIVHC